LPAKNCLNIGFGKLITVATVNGPNEQKKVGAQITQGGITMKKDSVSKTISLPISYYAMMEEIKQKKGIESFEKCIEFCVSEQYTKLGLGIP